MLKFKTLTWSNAFSYGIDNRIDFNNPIVQLVGKNGHGKSSIALILEEVLYNKNSKGTKRAKVLNRYSKADRYAISLQFEKDSDEYVITTIRGATQKVELLKNGLDISAHTATATYKLIENIIGYDHKTFTQIVYQSSASNLKFLTDTDTNRKKFLIDLLNLNRYTEIGNTIKEDLKSVNQEIEVAEMKLKTVSGWLEKIKPSDLIKRDLVPVPATPTDKTIQLAELNEKLRTLTDTNAKIQKNNTYRKILEGIQVEILPEPNKKGLLKQKLEQAKLDAAIASLRKTAAATILDTCPSCKQAIDNSHKKAICDSAKAELPQLLREQQKIIADVTEWESLVAAYDASLQKITEVEKYTSLVNKDLPEQLLDGVAISAAASLLSMEINRVKTEIDVANKQNVQITAHNVKVDVLTAQQAEHAESKSILDSHLSLLNTKAASLQILAKTFSPSGFIAYKIESLVKDLEFLTNSYLADMSDGRFQLEFKVSSSDKLDVLVVDNGQEADITDLSTGELGRVNISTLLAIRKLMQSLSSVKSNLLILDETIEHLDAEGKEKLIEVLLKEEHLNTILVSHGFSHPLITKLEVVKKNKISRIE